MTYDFLPDGRVRHLYDEDLPFEEAVIAVERASEIEWEGGRWVVRRKGDGKLLFTSRRRSECLLWEKENDALILGG